MCYKTTYILIIFTALSSVVQVNAQSSKPDVVCVGSTKNYFVIATPGSSYKWQVNGELPEASTSNSVDIQWTTSGLKTLTVQEITKDNCMGPIRSMQVTVNEASYSQTIRTICPLQLPFVWNGISCTSAGTYRTTIANAVGCDSIVELVLEVNDPLVSRFVQRVCNSELPFKWNNQLLNSSGTYFQKFTTVAGCDSLVYLTLEVPQIKSNTIRDTICVGESKYFVGKNISESGTYTKMLKDEFGCDSIVTLHLVVEKGTTTTQRIQLFTGESITINGNRYSEPGTYVERYKEGSNCFDELITELSFIPVPNTITPNGDGINDVFMKGHDVKIYNRNGILIFDGNDGWDGKHRGIPVAKDTYFYILFYENTLQKPKNGYITVLR